MQKYFNNVTNFQGRAVANATVSVTTLAGAVATLYSDDGVTLLANPLTTDENGYFEFYAANGHYNLAVSGRGIDSFTIGDVILFDYADGVPPEDGSVTDAKLSGSNSVLDAIVTKLRFLADGAGAVYRSLRDKLRDQVSASDYATLQEALDTGKDVVIYDDVALSGPVTMSTPLQRLTCAHGAVVHPQFDGDVIRVTGYGCRVRVNISGGAYAGPYTQPRTGSAGSAIVVGYGGADAQQSSVAGSRIENFYGIGIAWENGAMLDMTGAHIFNCTIDGIRATSNYGDNNHGLFANTHVISCGSVGYNIQNVGAVDHVNNSRSNVFLNAKAFQCGKNFFIGTINNTGSVFSELGVTPDEFGPYSRGNNIQVIETDAAYASWDDNGAGNILSGYSSFDQWRQKLAIIDEIHINTMLEGYRKLTQSAARTFLDTIFGTTGSAVVEYDKGEASSRTDYFKDRVMFNGGGIVRHMETGTLTASCGTLAAGATYYFGLTGLTTAEPGDTLLVTISGTVAFGSIGVIGYIHAGGGGYAHVVNNGSSSIDVGDVTVRWVLLKH